MVICAATLLLALATAACSDSDTSPPADATATDTTADAGPDPSEALYDPNTLVTVEVEMPAADWQLLRDDKRNFAGNNLSCPSGPFPNTYTWRQATKVTINGKTVSKAGIRKKGFIGSVNSVKPSLKIRFDKFVEGQELFGITRLTLNNNLQDASQLVQCLTYDLARTAGLVASRCNFAAVTVNGEFLGVYSNIESIKKRMVGRFFDSAQGHLYEGTLSDFRDDWMVTFEAKTDETDPKLGPIKAVTEALKADDAKLMEKLSPLLDIEGFSTFWALNQLVGNADSYFTKGNNFFTYTDPAAGGKMHFIPWGVDATFEGSSGKAATFNVGARPMLARRLYMLPAGQVKYFNALKKLLAEVWDETALKDEIDRMEALIAVSVGNGPKLGKGGKGGKGGGFVDGGGFAESVEDVRKFVAGRRALVQSAIDSPPQWTQSLSARNCSGGGGQAGDFFEAVGTFKTTAGTKGSTPAKAGSGTWQVKQNGKSLKVSEVSSFAGVDDKFKERYQVGIRGDFDAGEKGTATLLAVFIVDAAAMMTATTFNWAKGSKELEGAIGYLDPKSSKFLLAAKLSGCKLIVDKTSTKQGEAIEGSFDCKWGSQGGKADPAKACYDACRKKGGVPATCKSSCYKK